MQPRTITKRALARLYCPELTPAAARVWLWRQLRDTEGLLPALRRAGFDPSSKVAHFTKRQCAIILRHLGPP